MIRNSRLRRAFGAWAPQVPRASRTALPDAPPRPAASCRSGTDKRRCLFPPRRGHRAREASPNATRTAAPVTAQTYSGIRSGRRITPSVERPATARISVVLFTGQDAGAGAAAASPISLPAQTGLSRAAKESQITIEPAAKHPRITNAAGYPISCAPARSTRPASSYRGLTSKSANNAKVPSVRRSGAEKRTTAQAGSGFS